MIFLNKIQKISKDSSNDLFAVIMYIFSLVYFFHNDFIRC